MVKDEIIIVINLFKNLKKDETNDQKYIFDSIINYCRMKENNLHNYIEEREYIRIIKFNLNLTTKFIFLFLF